VEDYHVHRDLIRQVLQRLDVNPIYVVNPEDDATRYLELQWVIDAFEQNKPDILILDMAWTGSDGEILDGLNNVKENVVEFWNRKKKAGHEPQVFRFLQYLEKMPVITVILTDYRKGIGIVLKEIINNRADRILLEKPLKASVPEYDRLLGPVLAKCMNARRFIRHAQMDVVSDSSLTIETLNTAMEVANTDAPILLTGETGIGKTFLAHAIHMLSRRADGPFVERNIASIPHELFYSTLFGHEKGAFTGAVKYKQGILEQADRGTVFLDEIGDLPEEEQVFLLKAIEEGQVYPLGGEGSGPIKTNVRYIVATNKDIEQQVRAGKFRKDLYYRLNVIQLKLAPLRERKGDIILFIEFFLTKFSRELGREKREITDSEMARVLQYDFPGNIRQLRSIVYRAVLLNKTIVESIQYEGDLATGDATDLDELVRWAWARIFLEKRSLKEALAEIEARLVQKADAFSDNNKDAAELLHISLSSFELKKNQAKNLRSI
jgi:DNA-binding NtrC family response regulator